MIDVNAQMDAVWYAYAETLPEMSNKEYSLARRAFEKDYKITANWLCSKCDKTLDEHLKDERLVKEQGFDVITCEYSPVRKVDLSSVEVGGQFSLDGEEWLVLLARDFAQNLDTIFVNSNQNVGTCDSTGIKVFKR